MKAAAVAERPTQGHTERTVWPFLKRLLSSVTVLALLTSDESDWELMQVSTEAHTILFHSS